MQKKNTVFNRLFHKWPAIIAMAIIGLTILVAIFAYPIATDDSPDANRMIVELSARPISYKQQFLLVPKRNQTTSHNFISGLFTGTPQNNFYIPINGYKIVRDTLTARHYIDYGLEDTISYSLSKFQIPPSITDKDHWIKTNKIKFEKFYLGTDRFGRDILSRLLVGARVSIAVGIVSVVLSLSIGIILGALAGWFGGFLDDIIMWIINILWSIPTILLVFAITLTIGKGFWEIFIAIGLTSWVTAARLIRGQTMQLKEMDFIIAAKSLGYKDMRIIFRHILPNIAGPIMVIASANFATAILIEAGLSFLGIGVQPPTPSWGLMIKENYTFLVAGNPIPALLPGLAIMILVLAFNILGNALRDAIDVRKI